MDNIVEATEVSSASPVVTAFAEGEAVYDFSSVIKFLNEGKRVYKLEWDNREYYGVMDGGQLKLHKPDGELHPWILSDGDLNGTDWIIAE